MTKLTGLQIDTMNTRILLRPGHPLALCWHYCSSDFEEEQVQVHTANGALRELMVTWAVGVLADGDWEALGAWPGAAVGRAFWRYVWEDLDRRGVDKISLLCASDVDAQTVCPVINVLQPFRQISGQGDAPAASSLGGLRAEARRRSGRLLAFVRLVPRRNAFSPVLERAGRSCRHPTGLRCWSSWVMACAAP